jgi:hypothetical protein
MELLAGCGDAELDLDFVGDDVELGPGEPSPIAKSPRRIVKPPSKTPLSPCAVKVAGTTTSCVAALDGVNWPATSYLLPPSALTPLETKRAVGKRRVLNHGLPATSSSPSGAPVSTLASSTSNAALAAVGLAGSKLSWLEKRLNLPSTATPICL